MYQYRNLPPRHQAPGFYPPHQPSLRRHQPPPPPNPHHPHTHPQAPPPNSSLTNTPLTRSHSHGILHPISNQNNHNGYRTHHIISPVHSPPPHHIIPHTSPHRHHQPQHHHVHSPHTPPTNHTHNPNALYAIQQMQRIKAATACQIINNRVVEAIREQQLKKLAEKIAKKKANPNWKDPNITNPNNSAYKPSFKHGHNHVRSGGSGNSSGGSVHSYHKPGIKDINTSDDEHEHEHEHEDDAPSHGDGNEISDNELTENDKMMTIPQLEISTAPKSTANITNLTDEELKMNPELYKMFSYYNTFATTNTNTNITTATSPVNSHTTSTITNASSNGHHISHLRSQSLPPVHGHVNGHNKHHHRTNMGPRRRNPNFLKPQLTAMHMNMAMAMNMEDISDEESVPSMKGVLNINISNGKRAHSTSPIKHKYSHDSSINNGRNYNHAHGHSHMHGSVSLAHLNNGNISNGNIKTKMVPIGKVKPNPLERNPPTQIIGKSNGNGNGKRTNKHYEPHIAPAHANVQSVISPNGGIYHPCHGYSTRDISIFDLFPGIVKYQSKKYAEGDRVDYLLTLSEKSFCSVNNRPLSGIDESEMWYIALKYLFNDITLGQFDYMSIEMRYVIKQYMSTHKNRLTFLNSIKNFGFLRVISDISKKLPIERIQKIIRAEKEKREKEKLLQLCQRNRIKEENRKKLLFQQQQAQFAAAYQQQQHIVAAAAAVTQQYYTSNYNPNNNNNNHYADWYNGNRLKRTISEPTPIIYANRLNINNTNRAPTIIDDSDDNDDNDNDIDDSWNFITEIVNDNKVNGNKMAIPDLPPEKLIKNCDESDENNENNVSHFSSNNSNENINGLTEDVSNDMDEIVDVYTMLYQSMKDETTQNINMNINKIDDINDNGPNISFADLTNINNNISDQFVPKVNCEKIKK